MMNPISDKQPLTKSSGRDDIPSHARLPTTTIIRPKQPRRYKLLPRDKLRIPSLYSNHQHGSSGNSNRIWKRDHYMKHMPLIAIDPDDDDEIEEFNGAIFTKVANKDLRDLLIRDKPIHSQRRPKNNGDDGADNDDDDDDDWELCLAPPSQPRRRLCCPCECTIS